MKVTEKRGLSGGTMELRKQWRRGLCTCPEL